jgi:hypothetical protein
MRAEALLVPLLTTTPPGFTMPAVVMDVSTDNSVTHEEQKKVPETKVLAPKK